MSTVTVPFATIAKAARSMLNSATLPADDNTQAILAGVKSFLDGVASGGLVVSAAPTAPGAPAPAVAAVPPRTTGRKVGAPPIPKPVNTKGGTVVSPEHGVQHG
jgi:hypothetical protein